MITSRQNPKIKKVIQLSSRAKYRNEDAAYVVEGVRILEDCFQFGSRPEYILYTDSLDSRGEKLLAAFQDQGIPCEEVDPPLFQESSSTETTQGILAVVPIPPPTVPDDLQLVLILDEIRDPGNLGTLLRTSLAAGADLVLLSKGTADPYAPKVVRSAMGAHFQLPLIKTDWEEIGEISKQLHLVLADMNAEQALWEIDLNGPVGLIVGSEAHGAGEQAQHLADQRVRIPMDPRAESLNAAVAGSLLLFETRRQRGFPHK